MKYFSLVLIGFLHTIHLFAQETKTFTIHAGTTIFESLPHSELYHFPVFTDGQVHFQNGISHHVKLNYNYYFGQMQFVGPRGDTLNIADAKTLKYIAIASDTFYYDKEYLQQLKSNNVVKLVVGEKIRVLDKQRIGGYGQPTSTAAINIYDSYSGSHQLFKLTLQENLILIKEKKFYIGDTSNHFTLLNRKNVLKLFPYREKDMSKYINENDINFNKQEDVVKFADFLFALKSR